jgi:hypothetical protein
MIKTAKIYRDVYGFSVIPLKKDKRPLIKWEELQRRKATKMWFEDFEDVMIGIVTGSISGIAVVDFDDKSLVTDDMLKEQATPVVSTPRGYHYYFKYREGITNSAHIGGNKIDVRGEGGYVVAPPSILDDGRKYTWIHSLRTPLQKFPLEIFEQAEDPIAKAEYQTQRMVQFEEGARDESFFTIACNLVRGGMAEDEIRKVMTQLHGSLPPSNEPFTLKEAMQKVDQALKRPEKRIKRWSDEVRGWVSLTHGYFPNIACYSDLGAKTPEEKANIRMQLKKLKDEKVIEPHPKRNGYHRLIQKELEEIDWKNAQTKEIDLRFPLGIEEFVKIYPKTVIMVAGKSDSGKTGFLLEFAKLNQGNHKINFFMNEASDEELAVRLKLFKGMRTEDWKCTFFRRDDNFEDVIRPNEINIIDYLDVTEDFAHIGTPLKSIHSRLDKGVALIAIQKNPKLYDFKTSQYIDIDLGIGGAKSIGKSRLYLSIDDNEIKIVKAKNRRGKKDPNGLKRRFSIYDGHDFVGRGLWHKPGWDRPDEEQF